MQEIRIPVTAFCKHSPPLVQFGLPIPNGILKSFSQMSVELGGVKIEASAQATSMWHDNSIKSCHITIYPSEKTLDNLEVIITSEQIKNAPSIEDTFSLDISQQLVCFKTEHTAFSYDLMNCCFELCNINGLNTQQGSITLSDSNNTILVSKNLSLQIVRKQCLLTSKHTDIELIITGSFSDHNGQVDCLFTITFAFFNHGQILNIKYNLHNPKAAEHKGGLWDLGDPNSFNFNNLSLKLDNTEAQPLEYSTSLDEELSSIENEAICISQHASGGDNWQSPVHVDKSNKVPLTKNGFDVTQQDQLIATGSRATPTLRFANRLQLTQTHFWQNFPSSITAHNQSISFDFFPAQKDSSYELQGGEKKTHEIWLSSIENDNLAWVHSPTSVKLPDTWLTKTHFAQLMSFSSVPPNWQTLINNSLDSNHNFFEKREQLDEFGWRNFGDLYADHETAEHTGKDIFVSHYNNQYDPVLGFLKQYLHSGDNRWFELADDLAKHVVDIDIYHTQKDKVEYNGGLFWHTDHYLQAYTSSHRSYSQHQPSDAYQDHAGGGGPGGQHCYTTGLAMHYMLTASEPSKQAVLTLTNWITHVYESSGTCLELLLAFKNRSLAGFKNHFTGQYPLDRGTANYVIALLDSFELTQEQDYLHRAEHVLKNSFHPNEDINSRNLEDVENTWFYTVLLQAVCKYLAIKESMHQLDDYFYYCRDSLLNFARWMTVYENPYLEKPDILEYPNDTWTAQDLRKVQIFAAAYYYSPIENIVFLNKAKYFQDDILNRLNSSATKTYTRIMVLILQNYGFLDLYKNKLEISPYKQVNFNWPKAEYEKKSLLSGALTQLLKRLSKLSIKSEVNWLKKRLN
ncbi:hypothetical protein L0668_06460 [Paraglaciecola aquimarina]|uniref:PcRGLX/YetA-like C-terminal alpha/alpha toroid domain-containing protein n=1 Tax=Paraglaciecola algarum TaxID=3050085 RepID=A0ABS9D4P3_9ALTE|nr:hypothetical protein [Paraglaciecola sp. G1-23]MCF2947740.1 hypothetical protein [Paraglaciecola sp. G1-23]